MKKTLRFSLLSMLIMLCGSVFAADDVTISAEQLSGLPDGAVTVSGYTFTADKGEGSSKPAYNANGKDVRLYANNTLNIASANGNITKITFNLSAQGLKRLTSITASTGTIAAQAAGDETVTWTGSATSVTFTVGEKAVYGTDGDSKAGQFDFASVVFGEGGEGTDPGTDPGNTDLTTVSNIAAFKALAAKTEAVLTLTNAEVLYVNGTNDIYVRDASGAIDFFKTDLSYTAGQKLNGSVTGIYDLYQNTPEFTKSSNTNDSKITATAGTVTPKSIAPADAANNICDLVKFSNVTLTESNNRFYAGDVQIYDKFRVVKGTPEAGKAYDIEGIIIMYNDIVEICPTSDYTDGSSTEEELKTATISEFNAAAESNTVWYQLSGTVNNLKDGDKYGNFDLEDETASVYVYGLLSEKGGAKGLFQDLAAEKGIKNGTKITIIGNRGSYQGKIEVLNAYFVSVDGQAVAELVISGETEFTESTTVTITPSDVDHDVYYTLDGSDPSNTANAQRYMGPFTITETTTVKAYEEDAELTAEKTFTKVEVETITVEDVIAAAPESTKEADGQQKVWVKGYIVGFVNGQAYTTGATFTAEGCETKTNLLLATDPAETDVEKCIPIQLPSGNVRNDLNLQDNPEHLGKEVLLYGHVLKYFSVPGLKNTSDYKFTGDSHVAGIATETQADGKRYNTAGQRVNDSYKGIVITNGKKIVVK